MGKDILLGLCRSNAEADGGQHVSPTVSKQFDISGKCRLTHAGELFRRACV